MRIVCREQHTAEWMQARTGIYTGSRAADGMQRLSRASKNGVKGDWASSNTGPMSKSWLGNRLPGLRPTTTSRSQWKRGLSMRAKRGLSSGCAMGLKLRKPGLCSTERLNYLGASPDGYVMENGVAIPIELKVPLAKTHQLYLGEGGAMPEIYVPQLMTEMLCCDRAPYGYFASYCPPTSSRPYLTTCACSA